MHISKEHFNTKDTKESKGEGQQHLILGVLGVLRVETFLEV
jgi:hypothetical protein